jgi:hypothetical protein
MARLNGADVNPQQPGNDLATYQVLLYGALGGIVFVVITQGFLDHDKIRTMLAESTDAGLQGISLAIWSLAIACSGALWAIFHKPVAKEFVAFQLGLVAPLALTAMVEGAGKLASKQSAGGVISRAYAADATRMPISQNQSGPVRCIVRSLVKKPC